MDAKELKEHLEDLRREYAWVKRDNGLHVSHKDDLMESLCAQIDIAKEWLALPDDD